MPTIMKHANREIVLIRKYPEETVSQVLQYVKSHYRVEQEILQRCPYSIAAAFLTDWMAATGQGITITESEVH